MALTAGTKAPSFSSKDQDGKEVKLSDFKGKKVVLYFYPKDMTPGCTAEACSLRDNYHALMKAGYEVLGVSTDNEKSHQKFIAKEKLPFRLLADTDRKLHEAAQQILGGVLVAKVNPVKKAAKKPSSKAVKKLETQKAPAKRNTKKRAK